MDDLVNIIFQRSIIEYFQLRWPIRFLIQLCVPTPHHHISFTKIYYTHFQILRFMINVLKDDLQELSSSPFIAIGLDDSKDQASERHCVVIVR